MENKSEYNLKWLFIRSFMSNGKSPMHFSQIQSKHSKKMYKTFVASEQKMNHSFKVK